VYNGQATHFDLFSEATASSQRVQAEKTANFLVPSRRTFIVDLKMKIVTFV
jgi:hypothetical protein